MGTLDGSCPGIIFTFPLSLPQLNCENTCSLGRFCPALAGAAASVGAYGLCSCFLLGFAGTAGIGGGPTAAGRVDAVTVVLELLIVSEKFSALGCVDAEGCTITEQGLE